MPSAPIPQNERARQSEVKRYAVISPAPEAVFDRLTRLASHLFQCPVALLTFVDGQRQWFKSCIGLDFSEGPRSESFCAWAILDRDVMVVPDTTADERFVDNPLVTGQEGLRFYAGAPLVSSQGYKLGTLCVADLVPRPQGLSTEEIRALTDLAAIAMDALEARRAENEVPPGFGLTPTGDSSPLGLPETHANEDRRRWLELLLQTPAAMALMLGPQYILEWINPAYERLMGRPAVMLTGRPILEALPELATKIYTEMLQNIYRKGEAFHGHEALIQLSPRSGEVRDLYVNFVCLPTRNRAGEIDGIFAHITDVTGEVMARRRIEDSERQFRTLAESIPQLTWMADEAGNIFWYNRRWFDYTGTTLDQMRGWGWQKVHDPEVLPEVLTNWRTAVSTGQRFEMTFPLRGADGEFRLFLTRVEPITDSGGKVVRWFGTNTDITEQSRTEEKLRRINRDLEEFSYVVSHDLQEPLRMVNIYTQLLLKNRGGSQKDVELFARYIAEGVSRMDILIHDLLGFSRTVHAGEVETGCADLAAAFAEALGVLKSRVEESGALITLCELPVARGETSQVAHVFQNILSNALKYRKPESTPEIHVAARREGDKCVISIRDNGIGFEPQYAERIFGLFKRLHKEEYPGTGLGLAICKRIIERYGGRMWAESVPGVGSTFYLSLPITP